MGVRVGVLTLYLAGGPYICAWVFFCGSGAVYPLLLLGVGLALTEPILVWLLCPFSWGTCGLPLRAGSLLPFSGSTPC